MSTARRPRGERTRAHVLEAALRVLAREGPRGVTHRAVAEEAGTSVRGTTYYFASRAELLHDAFAHYTEQAVARFDAIAEAGPPPDRLSVDEAAAMLAAIVESDLEQDRAGLVAEFELVLDVARGGDLEAQYRVWQDRLEGMLGAYARALGSTTPEAHARVVLATLRGLEIEALARPSHRTTHAELASVFRVLLAGIVGEIRRTIPPPAR
jgi:DNA-binding transcriptional regulator YbjK